MESQFHFEWDPKKAIDNVRKHGVSFERAGFVFNDPEALTVFDAAHSGDEERWTTIGLDNQGSVVVVSHTWRDEDAENVRCRIISARKATVREIRQYRRE
jgi:uncharacterized DUF497 family protein